MTTTITTAAVEQDMYIQFCGSWIISAETKAAHIILNACTAEKGSAANGRKFAEWLRINKIGKRVSNINNMLPELRAIAVNY